MMRLLPWQAGGAAARKTLLLMLVMLGAASASLPPECSQEVACGGTSSLFPDVDKGVVCGDCKVLVNHFQAYGSCRKYCESMGRTCVSAAEETADNCEEKYSMSCDENAGGLTSDALCECSADTSLSPPGACGQTSVSCGGAAVIFPDVDGNVICGECKVLVDRFQTYGSCNAYCASMGRTCLSAAEEQRDTCDVEYTMSCEDDAGGSTSDAICECSASHGAPLPPSSRESCSSPRSAFSFLLFLVGAAIGSVAPPFWLYVGHDQWRDRYAEKLPHAGPAVAAIGLVLFGFLLGAGGGGGSLAWGVVIGAALLLSAKVAYNVWVARRSGEAITMSVAFSIAPPAPRSRTNPLAAADQQAPTAPLPALAAPIGGPIHTDATTSTVSHGV